MRYGFVKPHINRQTSYPAGNRKRWVTGIILILILVAIFVGFFIIRSDRTTTISSTGAAVRLRMNQNMSPWASEHITGSVINSQLFGRDRTDLYTGSVRDAAVSSREFLDNYLPQNVRNTLKQRGDFAETDMLKHVFYSQYIDGLPVYGSHIAVHVEGGNNVRGITASVVTAIQVEPGTLSKQQASDLALQGVRAEFPDIKSWRVGLAENIIFNSALRGFSQDARNIPALLVNLQAGDDDDTGGQVYIISLVDGHLLDRYSEAIEVRERTVFNCPTFDPDRPSTVICNQSRTENAPALGIADADKAFDSFGTVYDTFSTVLGRKSFDNQDGALIGRVNLPSQLTRSDGRKPCEKGNAWWNSGSKSMFYCAGWVSLDISAHEIGHGVVFSHVPDMGRNFQMGAINEGVADMFGMIVDSDDWNMGDESPIGIIRHLDDPTKGKRPDRMHSEFFGCVANGAAASSSNDYGYIHKNATVLGKWFYLLAQGGAFNGCTTPGIGREKAMKIVHRSLSGGYIIPTANFRNFFDGAIAACADLFGATSPECKSANAAGLATEIDQQSPASQNGPKCTGAPRNVPICIVVPTETPIPGVPTNTPTPSPSPTPTLSPTPSPTGTPGPTATKTPQSCADKDKGNADCVGGVSITDYALWRIEYIGGCARDNLTSVACADDRDQDGSLMDADFTGDGKVSLADFQTWRNNFK